MSNQHIHRNLGIDFFKALSISAVVICHAHPFGVFDGSVRTTPEWFVNQLTRFAVPYFFIIFGYFVGKKLKDNKDNFDLWRFFRDRAKFILTIYAFWCLVYLVVTFDFYHISKYSYPALVYWKIIDILKHPLESIFTGTKTHLWFLPSLIISFLTVVLIYSYNKKYLLPITLILYLIGVLGGSYQFTAIGLDLPFDTRNGPFLGSFFITVGIVLSKRETLRVSMPLAMSLLCFGIIGQLSEVYFLSTAFKMDPTKIDYVFSTIIFGIAVMILAFSINIKKSTWFTDLGKYTLSVNLIHLLLIELLRPLALFTPSWIYAATVPLTVLILSFSTILIFSKFPKARPLLGMN
ncbi:MAG: acyltransferase [Gammaproteobacteria bacterium]